MHGPFMDHKLCNFIVTYSQEGDLALAAYYFCYSPYLNILKTFYNTWCSCTCTYKMENFLFILI